MVNGFSQTYQLSAYGGEADDVLVTIDGIVQRPNIDYTLVFQNLTFTQAPLVGETIGVRVLSGVRANWTLVDSTPFTASVGQFLLVNTQTSEMTINLPDAPS